ncbi:MAG TPA: four helix bundle protein [Chitinophagales bacterium]|nr:four helix bundle protein [Chitinophagales bacterium]HQO89405.1 four helix bundle protein [Chitinophagales bacterium]
MEIKENVIVEKSIDFSLSIIKYCEILEREKKFVIANQLLKAGTSIGANIFEAQHAESKQDFIHKMKIAMKETNETMYWLTLCEKSEQYPEIGTLKEDASSIFKIISKIIATSKNNSTHQK